MFRTAVSINNFPLTLPHLLNLEIEIIPIKSNIFIKSVLKVLKMYKQTSALFHISYGQIFKEFKCVVYSWFICNQLNISAMNNSRITLDQLEPIQFTVNLCIIKIVLSTILGRSLMIG